MDKILFELFYEYAIKDEAHFVLECPLYNSIISEIGSFTYFKM